MSAFFVGVLVISLNAVTADFSSEPKDSPAPPAAKNIRSAVLPKNIAGMPTIFFSDCNPRWSPDYDKYLYKLHDAVQNYWADLNEQNKVLPPNGTKIAVKIRLNSEGKTEIINANGNDDTQTTNLCKNAIANSAPYGKWTDEMVALFGDSQEMTLNFCFDYGVPSDVHAASDNRASKASNLAKIYDLGELDQKPQVTGFQAMAVYPVAMKRQGLSGDVALAFTVDTNGDARDVQVVKSTNREFEQSAIDAVSTWKFCPGKKDGKPVNVRVQASVAFNTDGAW